MQPLENNNMVILIDSNIILLPVLIWQKYHFIKHFWREENNIISIKRCKYDLYCSGWVRRRSAEQRIHDT